MSWLGKLIFAFWLFNLVFAPASAFAKPTPKEVVSTESGAVNSFELFWPIVAGKVVGEPFYFLKSFKETVREFFIFSTLRKSDYNITLSEKRTVEAEKLYLEKKDYANGQKTLAAAQAKRERGLSFLEETAAKGQPVTDLTNRFTSSLEKQRLLLNYIASLLPDREQTALEDSIKSLDALAQKLNPR